MHRGRQLPGWDRETHHRRALQLEFVDLSGCDGLDSRLAVAGAHAGSGQDVSRPRLTNSLEELIVKRWMIGAMFVLGLASAKPAFAAGKPMTIDDLLAIKSVSDAQI